MSTVNNKCFAGFSGASGSSAVELQKPVSTGCALVDDADLFGLCVAEDEEIVIEQIHLHDGFLHVHGLHDEMFCLDDWVFALVLVVDRNFCVGESLGTHTAVAETTFKFGFLLVNLTFEFFDDQID